MNSIGNKGRRIIHVGIILFLLIFMSAALVHAEGDRATFDTGSAVRAAFTSLAGGSRNNVKEIRQYSGSAVPEGVTAQTVSASDSVIPIYAWFDNGVLYYWSEDTHPYTNADSSFMFNGFTEVTFIDSAPFDTSMTKDMERMFGSCTKLKKLDVSGFDTSSVKCMYCMFYSDSSLEELDVSHFNVSNATSTSDEGYGSLCGMFFGCSSVKTLDLSSFDMTRSISYPYNVQNMFPGCTSLEKLILGPNVRFNSYTALSGSWTHVEDGMTLSGSQLTSGYNAANSLTYSGTWLRNMPEGHYYRTDGSLGQTNMWEVHSPEDKFKGYCLNLNKFGVGEEMDRVLAEDDTEIEKLLCTEAQGSVHGSEPLGSTMREALITLIYYGWPNDAAGIMSKYGLSDQEYMEITQNAVWDFTDRYDEPAGPSLYEGDMLAAYNELVSQRYSNIEGKYILFLYESWDPSKQNLLSIMGVDEDVYGGVCVRKQNENGSENLAGAEFTIYDEAGNEVQTIVTGADGTAYACRTDHYKGLPKGKYTIKETKAPAGYEASDWVYHFEITEPNVIVTDGWRKQGDDTIEEEMIYFDKKDETYEGGGVGIVKKSDTGKMLVGAEFAIKDSDGNIVKTLVTNDAGVAMTGKQDLPLGTYTVEETKAPEGHKLADPVQQTVEITKNMQFLTLTFEDAEKKGSITLEAHKLLDIPDQELEAGQFTFQLLDAHYNVIQEKTNDTDGNVIFDTIRYTPDDLGYKNYHIREVIGDTSQFRFDRHEEDVTVTIYDDGSDTLLCTAIYDSDGSEFVNKIADKKFKVQFMKKKLDSSTQIAGATIEIRDQANRLIESWVSDGTPYEIELEPGKYVVREISAPEGYYKRSDIKVEVTEEGELICSDPDACDTETLGVNIYDAVIASTGLRFRKVDSETGSPLENAEFTLAGKDDTNAGYTKTVTTGIDGVISFDNLETGSYELTETKAPYGYIQEDSPWTVDVNVSKAISRTSNVDENGVASGDYPSGTTSDTITLSGAEKIHVALKYQTEDNFDYLLLKDGAGNVIKQDADGKQIGNEKGYIWGGMESGEIREMEFDLTGDTVTFEFVADTNVGAYGYYAAVSTDPVITVRNNKGVEIALSEDDGLYELPNTHEEMEGVKAEIKVSKLLKGRDWQQGDSFTFELSAKDETFPLPEKREVTVTDDKEISFGEITYDKEGIYTYTIREKLGELKGMTYDDADHIVKVRVEDTDLDKVLEATVTYEDSTSETSAVIVNTYREEETPSDDHSKKDEETTNKPETQDKEQNATEADDEDDDTTQGATATGDESNIKVWIILTLLAMIGITVTIVMRRIDRARRQ